jgi:hypothetical protein
VKAQEQLRPHDRYVCDQCGARPPRGDYMVHDAVWAKAGMQRRGFLCLTCLEDRLIAGGQDQLTLTDFTNAPCNAALRFGHAMALRRDSMKKQRRA